MKNIVQHTRGLFFILILTAAAYSPCFKIPHMLSEHVGIRNHPAVTSFNGFFEKMVTRKGLLARPLSVFSYTLDRWIYGEALWGFHLTSLLIHLLNVTLLFFLSRRIYPEKISLLVTAIFALHPLSTATASLLFGRPYSLAVFFLLLGLHVFFSQDKSRKIKRCVILALLWILIIFSKQTLVIFPVVLVWMFGVSQENPLSVFIKSHRIQTLILAGTTMMVGLVFIYFYAIPYSKTAIFGPLVYVQSQLGNLWFLVTIYLVPFLNVREHMLPFYGSPFHPEVLAGLILAGGIFYSAFRFRKTRWGMFLGCMIIMLLPTQSVFPKNEIIEEWRLYPGLIFLALAVGGIFQAYIEPLKHKKLIYISFSVFLLSYGVCVYRQNVIYQSTITTWQQVLKLYPDSADAYNNLGVAFSRDHQSEKALENYSHAIENSPNIYVYYRNAAFEFQRLGRTVESEQFRKKSAQVLQESGPRHMSFRVK